MANIAVIGTLDTKGREHAFVADRIRSHGHTPLLIDVGTHEDPQVTPDVTREEVAACLEIDFKSIAAKADRGGMRFSDGKGSTALADSAS